MKRLVHKLMSRIDPGCETISLSSSASLDRSLSVKERLSLCLHLLVCDFCKRYQRQIKIIHDLSVDSFADCQEIIATMPSEARRRISEKIKEAAKISI